MAADLKSAQKLLLSCLIVFLFCRHIPLVNCKLECFATVNVTKENGENGCDPNFQVEAKFETASMCCLGNGFWFRNTNDSDECMQCIGTLITVCNVYMCGNHDFSLQFLDLRRSHILSMRGII